MKFYFLFLLLAFHQIIYSEIIHTNDFTKQDYFYAGSVKPEFTTYEGRNALKVSYNTTAQGTHMVFYKYNLGNFNGKTLKITCDIAAVNVTEPKESWNGVKLMYVYKLNGVTKYPAQSDVKYGTTKGWITTSFEIIAYTGEDIGDGTFSFGLQDSTGTVYFSNLIIESTPTIEPKWTVPEGYKCEYTDRVMQRTRARGAMSPKNYTEQDFLDFRSWNGNILRWQITSYPGDTKNLTRYEEWITAKLDELEKALNKAYELDMYIVIDIHAPPGGKIDMVPQMYRNKTFHDYYIELWKRIARRFKGYPNVYAYDLINEPGSASDGFIHYLQSQYEAIQVIREIDPDTPISVEFWPWPSGSPDRRTKVFPFKDIIYQLHMYYPGSYTHQGVNTNSNNTGEYPGYVSNTFYNKTVLENYLKEVFDFEEKYGAKVYVGEFSAIMWAKGNDQYLEDVIQIFEEREWDWTYHAYREWNGWSVEHEWINGPRVNTTKRKEVLLKYYKKNEKATMYDPNIK